MRSSRQRKQFAWTPIWEGGIKNWSIKYVRKNRWRCDGIHEIDDLLQDTYLIFVRIMQRYPRVTEPRNFMALYKTAVRNEICDHARYKRRKKLATINTPVDAAEYYAGRIGEVTNSGYLGALIEEAPEEVRLALAVFNDEEKLKELRVNPTQGKLRTRENLNMRLRRVTGIAAGIDITGLVLALLT